MSKKYPEFDENDPKMQERLAILDKINQQTTEKCNSWADLYQGLKDQVYKYFSAPDKENADFTITLLLCFVLALEDLPEEGDAQAISRQINEILVMHPERTGVALFFGEEANTMREQMDKALAESLPSLHSFLASLRATLEGAAVEDMPMLPVDKRTLH